MSKPSVTISKLKFKEIQEAFVAERGEEEASQILNRLCTILNFDPNMSSYSVEKREKTYEYRNKLKEQGISTYVSSGVKKIYEKKKKIEENKN